MLLITNTPRSFIYAYPARHRADSQNQGEIPPMKKLMPPSQPKFATVADLEAQLQSSVDRTIEALSIAQSELDRINDLHQMQNCART
jgi:hypothetical protein